MSYWWKCTPIVCGFVPFPKVVSWPFLVFIFTLALTLGHQDHLYQNCVRAGQERSSGWAGCLPCWPFGSGPAPKCFLAGKVINDVLGDNSLLWLWCQKLCEGCNPWAGWCKEAKDSHTVCIQNELYPQTERTLVMLPGKINSSLEHYAYPGCKHKLVHIYMQGMCMLLRFLPICGRRDQGKSYKEESLYNIHHQLFKATVWTRFLSHWHRQVRWEHWEMVAVHF